ncbi:MAG: hypothetical protein OEY61_01715 [Gammaproteobacteria bacterium]|nr:hypothetical protein [Gammaproteobacteria bacterium]
MRFQQSLCVLCLLLLSLSPVVTLAWTHYGYFKYAFNYTDIPANTIAYPLSGNQQTLNSLSLRLATEDNWDQYSAAMHYEISALHSNNPDLPVNIDRDRQRWFDLTSTLKNDSNEYQDHRLDRLTIAYSGERLVLRLGRQAVSWGNGFLFHALDIFNPFDPVALDTDYKTGDDMFYAQWLTRKGNDWQMILLPRRNPAGDLDQRYSSQVVKYHALTSQGDVDLLYAQHYDQTFIAMGYAKAISDAVWRFDFAVTELTDQQHVNTLVSNVDYSWVWFEHNIYGFAEYFYNGFAENNATLPMNSELTSRLLRGELFTRTRDYLALGLTIELHPLVNLSPTVILNLNDHSRLLPVSLNINWQENLLLKTSVILSAGHSLSEYGGSLSPGNQFNCLLSYYF